MSLPVRAPVEPMLAKLSEVIPAGDGWLYEPKWDGFRAIVFKDGGEIFVQSRDRRSLDRYFPELVGAFRRELPARCVVDGEIVIARGGALDFDALLLRIHPAESRIALLARQTPASFVAFDLLAEGDRDLRAAPTAERRARLERALGRAGPSVHVTPMTRDRAVAEDWFRRFEGAGLDGVVAKPEGLPYLPGKRAMAKIKHARTADCVVGGFRWHKGGEGERVGSLLLGLYDGEGVLRHVGVCAAFSTATRAALARELAPLRARARGGHPWSAWASELADARMPGASSRWNRGKDLSWEPLRIERVCEVAYDHLQGDRFRHATQFLRWRPDKRPEECRYDQLEVTPPFELGAIFAATAARAEAPRDASRGAAAKVRPPAQRAAGSGRGRAGARASRAARR